MHKLKVQGHDGLVRDMTTNAIINTDSSAYNDYVNSRNKKLKNEEEFEVMKNDIQELKNTMSQILLLLQKK